MLLSFKTEWTSNTGVSWVWSWEAPSPGTSWGVPVSDSTFLLETHRPRGSASCVLVGCGSPRGQGC